jgi:hypothetical protein
MVAMVEDQNGAEEMSRRSGNGKWEMGSRRSGKWETGSGTWEVGEVGSGKREVRGVASGQRKARDGESGARGVGGGGASEMGSVGLSLHSCSLGTSRSVHSLQILLVEVLEQK